MTEYESRKVRGWRSALEDMLTKAREQVSKAPARVERIEGRQPPQLGQVYGYKLWFSRIYGPERKVAQVELLRLRRIKQKLTRDERTEAEKELRRIKEHEWYLRRKARETPDARTKRLEANRVGHANRSHEAIERERMLERRRRQQYSLSTDWRKDQAKKKRLRRLAKPALYQAIDQRSKARTKDARNARRRERYAAQKAARL